MASGRYTTPQGYGYLGSIPTAQYEPSGPVLGGGELTKFDPSAPRFQPSYPTSAIQQYIAETRSQQAHDLSRVENMAYKNREAILRTNDIVQRDLQTLQRQIEDLRTEQHLTVVRRGPGILELEIPEPEMMLQHFSKDIVAEVYLEQAEVHEATARKLRQYYHELQPSTAPDGGSDIPEMVTHGRDDEIQTPTHAPARRGQISEMKPHTPADGSLIVPEMVTDGRDGWKPLGVLKMPPSPVPDMPNETETFSLDLLHGTFGGKLWSPGYYYIEKDEILPSKAYWILDTEPFLPSKPGQHGAKLTAFFNSTLSGEGEAPDVCNYLKTPVFIRKEGTEEYVYYGQYSQLRFSDKLDYDTIMTQVPKDVREYWAHNLADTTRPQWVTQALMEHFWPKPTYDGPIPTDSAVATPATEETEKTAVTISAPLEKRVVRALNAYAYELKDWQRDAKIKVNLLREGEILAAFEKADADAEPGLRLWWEYLQCVGYDEKFYDMLVRLKYMAATSKKK